MKMFLCEHRVPDGKTRDAACCCTKAGTRSCSFAACWTKHFLLMRLEQPSCRIKRSFRLVQTPFRGRLCSTRRVFAAGTDAPWDTTRSGDPRASTAIPEHI